MVAISAYVTNGAFWLIYQFALLPKLILNFQANVHIFVNRVLFRIYPLFFLFSSLQ